MKLNQLFGALALTYLAGATAMANDYQVRGYSLTETWKYSGGEAQVVDAYDAVSDNSQPPTASMKMVDRLFELGVRRINLSPQAHMLDPRGNQLVPNTKAGPERRREKARYQRLIRYIHGKGMTVGIRPIFFVLAKDGTPKYVETINGKPFQWWHGNIQPKDPNQWFESFKSYLKIYYPLAHEPGVEEFTLGAELYSLTVGIEDQWKEYPHGLPGEWVKVLNEARAEVPKHVKLMYDINFTDDRADAKNLSQFGGEFARWFYRLAGFAQPDPALVEFWNGLDAIGIDMYRSLALEAEAASLPQDYDALVARLQQKSDLYAQQIDQNLEKISAKLNKPFKDVIFKELGFASRELGFIRPFEYTSVSPNAKVNVMHQAAAYDAIFRSFVKPGFEWFRGIVFWDVSVNESIHGPKDHGFSPLGKPETEAVIKKYWN